VHYATQVLRRLLTLRYRHLLLNAGTCMQHSAPVAPPGEEGGKLPPYGWTSKNYVICVCFHCHRTSSYHTTNTLQGRRAKSHVDTQTIQPGLGDFVLQTPYRPMPHFPPVTKSWRRHCSARIICIVSNAPLSERISVRRAKRNVPISRDAEFVCLCNLTFSLRPF